MPFGGVDGDRDDVTSWFSVGMAVGAGPEVSVEVAQEEGIEDCE
jgi:hypothetical protein